MINRSSSEYKNAKAIWDEFVTEIKYKNRFFVGNDVISLLDEISRYVGTKVVKFTEGLDDDSVELYRARFGNYINHKEEQMMAPPVDKAKPGRMNPEGISYLYLATGIFTAIDEIRPIKEEVVTVAEFKLKKDNHIFNLAITKELDKTGVFEYEGISREAVYLSQIITDYMNLAVQEKQSIEYLPYQFISEYAKNKGFDGVSYKSSIGIGYNYVIFNEDIVELIHKGLYRISNLKIVKPTYELEIIEE